MKKILIIVLLVFFSFSVNRQTIDLSIGPKPIAVILQTDPWLMVIGSDPPMLVVYDNGMILYYKIQKNHMIEFLSKQLDTNSFNEVKKKLSSIVGDKKFKGYYDISPGAFDLPETCIYLSIGKVNFATHIYGLKLLDNGISSYSYFKRKNHSDTIPKALNDLYNYLLSLRFSDAKPWNPQYIEIMIGKYENAPDESIHWPKDWPGLNSPGTIKRGNMYSIFLPIQEISRLNKFLMTQKEKGAVEIGGIKWAVSVKHSFPSESVWQYAFKNYSLD